MASALAAKDKAAAEYGKAQAYTHTQVQQDARAAAEAAATAAARAYSDCAQDEANDAQGLRDDAVAAVAAASQSASAASGSAGDAAGFVTAIQDLVDGLVDDPADLNLDEWLAVQPYPTNEPGTTGCGTDNGEDPSCSIHVDSDGCTGILKGFDLENGRYRIYATHDCNDRFILNLNLPDSMDFDVNTNSDFRNCRNRGGSYRCKFYLDDDHTELALEFDSSLVNHGTDTLGPWSHWEVQRFR